MATVQVRNLDDEAYAVLRRRAADSGRSLQEYLRRLLEEQAARTSAAEQIARARADLTWAADEDGPTMSDIVEIQRSLRDR